MSLMKYFAITQILTLMSLINIAHAVVPKGQMVYPKVNTKQVVVLGGSAFSAKWQAPAVASYNVWVQVPSGSTASNALYRIYPKGNAVARTVCSSTDPTYPCFEATLDQTNTTDGWVQMLDNDTNTAWDFSSLGYITVSAGTTSNTELLGVSQLRFVESHPLNTSPLAIGQAYQGGIIFYLDSTKVHGLIAAPYDQSTKPIRWYNGSYIVTGASGTAIGTGLANTRAIITAQGAGSYAAKLCDDLVMGGYSDWYLPSKDELYELFKNKTVVGGFSNYWYWSSSEYSGNNDYRAWHYYFSGTGSQGTSPKLWTMQVRAIRAF